MVYAYDLWAQMPVRDLYDTQMMLAAVGAAKDMYEKGVLEIKDFKKEWGDFYTPIESQQQAYNDEFNVEEFINNIYERGGDPLRNKADRLAVQQYINSRNYGLARKLKRNAVYADEYVKNRARLNADGKFNPEFEKFRLGGRTLETWGVGDPFLESSPAAYEDLNEYTGHIFDKMDDSYIETKGGYDYYGVSREARERALTQAIPGLLSTDLGRFHYEKSKLNYRLLHNYEEPTEAEAILQYKDDILTATTEYEHRNRKENEEHARQREFYYSSRLASIRNNNSGSGGDKSKYVPSIFREAADYIPKALEPQQTPVVGRPVSYDNTENPYYNWIEPVETGITLNKSKDGVYVYLIPKEQLGNIYIPNQYDRYGQKVSARISTPTDAVFIPTGLIHGEQDPHSSKSFYLYGKVKLFAGVDKEGNKIYKDVVDPITGSTIHEMEVTERVFNYGQEQKKALHPDN